MTTRRLLLALLVGAAALVAAAFAITKTADRAHRGQQPISVTDNAPTPRSAAPVPRSRNAVPRSSAVGNRPPRPAHESTAPNRPAPAPLNGDAFLLTVTTHVGAINADVASISVASNQPVDPPHETAAQWNTAAWVEQSAYPSAHSHGTSYIYGHACHHHQCSFTRLKDAQVGDQVIATTTKARLTYRIDRIGLSPKSATALPPWAADSTVPGRLVLVTCAYEQGDTSTSNMIVVAQLQPA